MLLFMSIALLSLLISVIPKLVRKLPIAKYLEQRSQKNVAELQKKLDAAKEALRLVIGSHTLGEYAYQIKKMRAEENVKEHERALFKEKNLAKIKSASAETILVYGAKAMVSFILLIVSIRNRYTPVIVFDDKISFQPLTGLLSFPTGVPNAISVPIWIISCNVTINFVSNLLANVNFKKTKTN